MEQMEVKEATTSSAEGALLQLRREENKESLFPREGNRVKEGSLKYIYHEPTAGLDYTRLCLKTHSKQRASKQKFRHFHLEEKVTDHKQCC